MGFETTAKLTFFPPENSEGKHRLLFAIKIGQFFLFQYSPRLGANSDSKTTY